MSTLAERFATKYEPEPMSGCWLWTGAVRGPAGNRYGHMRLGGKSEPITAAHRVSWELANGRRPDEHEVVMHKCDNPMCVNPDHLEIGTHALNVHDCIAKGRFNRPFGARHVHSKLTDAAVRDIRTRRHPAKHYASKYGVSRDTVYGVLAGASWKHVC